METRSIRSEKTLVKSTVSGHARGGGQKLT